MSTNIDVGNFEPAKTKTKKRRKNAEGDETMDVELHNGIEGRKINRHRSKRRKFEAFSETKQDVRKIPVPAHRYTPLKTNWIKIFTPIVEYLQLNIRFNLRTRNVEIKTCAETKDIANLQKAADFVKAFICGFEVEDAMALLRLDDLFVETFDIKDVKSLKGDHEARAIGRLAGKGGTTKYSIENATKTRIVLADSRIHVLGSYQNVQVARRVICNLIMGSPPSKIFEQLRTISSRVSDRFLKMGGHHHFPKVPCYKIYKVEDVPELVRVQKMLAAKGLCDPWLRNEVWRYDVKKFGTEASRWNSLLFRGFKWGFGAFVITAIVAKVLKSGDEHGHDHH